MFHSELIIVPTLGSYHTIGTQLGHIGRFKAASPHPPNFFFEALYCAKVIQSLNPKNHSGFISILVSVYKYEIYDDLSFVRVVILNPSTPIIINRVPATLHNNTRSCLWWREQANGWFYWGNNWGKYRLYMIKPDLQIWKMPTVRNGGTKTSKCRYYRWLHAPTGLFPGFLLTTAGYYRVAYINKCL